MKALLINMTLFIALFYSLKTMFIVLKKNLTNYFWVNILLTHS